MPKQITIVFLRDEYKAKGCLEYSWVPEGLRHNIYLDAGEHEGESTDSIDGDLNPSNVQVYVANNNDAVSVEMWQFPEVASGGAPIVGALVEILERQNKISGRVFYSDGTTYYAERELDNFGRNCPQS